MTDKQPKALRLADELKSYVGRPVCTEAAAELRRLDALNAELVEALKEVIRGVPDTWEGVKQAKVVIDKVKNHG
jgi:hypothetical protein